MCDCVCAPACGNRLNLIYGQRGHLLTESKLLTGASPGGGLIRLLLYIAALMGTSLENLPLLICASLPRFQHFAHGTFLWETPDALMLRRINQSSRSPYLLPARTPTPRRAKPGGLGNGPVDCSSPAWGKAWRRHSGFDESTSLCCQ